MHVMILALIMHIMIIGCVAMDTVRLLLAEHNALARLRLRHLRLRGASHLACCLSRGCGSHVVCCVLQCCLLHVGGPPSVRVAILFGCNAAAVFVGGVA